MPETANEFIYDAANEIIVIGAAITGVELRRRLVHQLSADEFLVPVHGPIWRALRKMSDAGLEYTSEVARRCVLDEGGDEEAVQYLASIEAAVPENLDYHLTTLQWDAMRARSLKGAVPALLQALQDPKASPGEVITAARSVSRGLEGGARRFIHKPSELFKIYRAEIASRRVKRNVYPLGEVCFDDNLTEGFMPGKLTVTAGLPGVGKSTIWIAFAIMLAKLGRKVLFACWEMEAESVLDVAIAHMTGIPLKRIVQGELTDAEDQKVSKASRWLLSRISFMGNPFYTQEMTRKPSNARNLDVIEGYIAESGCNVGVFDLWERMLAWRGVDDVTSALFRMQAIFKEYGMHGIIVHQLRLKDVEKRADKRPTRESIKGTGAFVEVSDLIFGIHREGQFKDVEDNTIETICLKQRKGKANWAIRWDWNGATCFVGNPKIVSYDPGLENSVGIGDISSIQTKGSRSRGSQQIGRREQ